MKFISWNVNGLRAVMKKGFEDIFADFDADIVALQEIKLQEGQIDLHFEGYHDYWSHAERKGYSGTAVFTRHEPNQVLHGLGIEEFDNEGRICALDLKDFWFVNVYTPNAQPKLARLDHRMGWDDAFRDFCLGLQDGILPSGASCEKKPVVMCGDFNVAHNEIDLKNPSTNHGNPGFSDEEREKFTCLLDAGFVDTWRTLHPDTAGVYSWWSYRFNARANNSGWRIDYFLTSKELFNDVDSADIYCEIMGSDHCPVGLTLK